MVLLDLFGRPIVGKGPNENSWRHIARHVIKDTWEQLRDLASEYIPCVVLLQVVEVPGDSEGVPSKLVSTVNPV